MAGVAVHVTNTDAALRIAALRVFRARPKVDARLDGLQGYRVPLAGAAAIGALCASASRSSSHATVTFRAASRRAAPGKKHDAEEAAVEEPEPGSSGDGDRALANEYQTKAAELQSKLLRLAASCDRGQQGTPALRLECEAIIADLEALQAADSWDQSWSQHLDGEWQLVYATEDPTRSSPFFWAFRKAMAGVKDPFPSRVLFGSEELSENILTFSDNIPLKSVGVASQTFQNGQVVSRVGVRVFPTGESTMTTTSQYRVKQQTEDARVLGIEVEKTQVVGSSLAASFLENYEAPTGEWLGEAAEVEAQVTFLDDRLRVMRDADRPSACFVYARAP
mmetsp:Transcript_60149/g.135354  ORF Transcript_60149/g.135354 Transcript_60149/m.135354 type:complete len:336 (-) Transcript_60149:47-1054(-)